LKDDRSLELLRCTCFSATCHREVS